MKVKDLINLLHRVPLNSEVRLFTSYMNRNDDSTNYWVVDVEVEEINTNNELIKEVIIYGDE